MNSIEIIGAREHNLKNINVTIPKNKLVVITGKSGSGKSSLIFNTIYSEGQRRYLETLSNYASNFIENLGKPDVDKINGLSPIISIAQKNVNKNIRSTVGTMTEIYDFLRLLFSKTADAFSYATGEKMVQYKDEKILDIILKTYKEKKITILSPLIKSRKGSYTKLFKNIASKGFLKLNIDNQIRYIENNMSLDRHKIHDIDIVIDTLKIDKNNINRISESIKTGLKNGNNSIIIIDDKNNKRYFSKKLMCPSTGISYHSNNPNIFSFNSPYGACEACKGLGFEYQLSIEKIIPNNNKSIKQGGIVAIGEYKDNWLFNQIKLILSAYNLKLSDPISSIPSEVLNLILNGGSKYLKFYLKEAKVNRKVKVQCEGIINLIKKQNDFSKSLKSKKNIDRYTIKVNCKKCNGNKLKKEALHFKIDNKNIIEISNKSLDYLYKWVNKLEKKLDEKRRKIYSEIIDEIKTRLKLVIDLGLGYLSLNRGSKTLSGGESQRIRLASQVCMDLVGIIYVLDEPSIGLHQRDNLKIIKILKDISKKGNSVLVIEHDKEIMQMSDYIIDIGPSSGENGGLVTAEGTLKTILKKETITSNYLKAKNPKLIETKKVRKKTKSKIQLINASGHNLKNINLNIPLRKLICVTGVSGSGKSSLINKTLYPILKNEIYGTNSPCLKYEKIKGISNIDKVISINQTPISKLPRSNAATYVGFWNDIRNIFSNTQESKIKGLSPGHFSFNIKGGRCDECEGSGLNKIKMNLISDVEIECESCQGNRFKEDILNIKYKDKNIYDILEMTIDEAYNFFSAFTKIKRKIKIIKDVGLGYIKLGQRAPSLSGGESQRIKLASELYKKDTGNTLYILDEPTTGLHFEDIKILLNILNKIVEKGNTVIIIEHNMDVIKSCDYIIDIGPDSGEKGGNIVCEGSPKKIYNCNNSYTSLFLRKQI